VKVRDAILAELDLSPDLASRGFFNLTKGDSVIIGPSVHLARLVLRNFENASVRSHLVGETAEGIYSVAGVLVDFEKNVVFERVLPVSVLAWRTAGSGGYVELKGEQLMQALLIGASKAERNVIAAGVPDSLMQQAFVRCKQLAAENSRSKLGEMIEHCEQFGVTRVQLERALGAPLDAKLSDDQIVMLRGFANGLTSGDVKAPEIGVEAEPEPQAAQPVDVDAIISAGATVTKGVDARLTEGSENGEPDASVEAPALVQPDGSPIPPSNGVAVDSGNGTQLSLVKSPATGADSAGEF
jgi:hypothetical protein